ncbi:MULTISPECIES: hypothetical protein [Geomicrobium]|uniref:Uncharacterized protein n=1 Tax=Geomicrobium sediminis TaxID=1347788 RepID=A0ABS2PDM5_9BACL|nr:MULTISPECIES: hypothetical protein [Geomicrobium]MBM7632908.1 hypothetical protein [Geomicrobium sediminis]GAJ98006.1 hypothetical protein JCM19055_907 [Geomicrobium sp. JCM 19055]
MPRESYHLWRNSRSNTRQRHGKKRHGYRVEINNNLINGPGVVGGGQTPTVPTTPTPPTVPTFPTAPTTTNG